MSVVASKTSSTSTTSEVRLLEQKRAVARILINLEYKEICVAIRVSKAWSAAAESIMGEVFMRYYVSNNEDPRCKFKCSTFTSQYPFTTMASFEGGYITCSDAKSGGNITLHPQLPTGKPITFVRGETTFSFARRGSIFALIVKKKVEIWDLSAVPKMMNKITPNKIITRDPTLALSEDGHNLAVCNNIEGVLELWNIAASKPKFLKGIHFEPQKMFCPISFLPHNRLVIQTTDSATIFNLKKGKELFSLKDSDLHLESDYWQGNYIVWNLTKLVVWNLNSRQKRLELNAKNNNYFLAAVTKFTTTAYLLVASSSGKLHFYNLGTGPVRRFGTLEIPFKLEKGVPPSMSLARDGKTILIAGLSECFKMRIVLPQELKQPVKSSEPKDGAAPGATSSTKPSPSSTKPSLKDLKEEKKEKD